MGEVYAVRDEHAQEDRALKIMRADIADSEAARQRFRNESKVRRLNHDCIVNTIDIGEAADQHLLYISMELVDGISLREEMNQTRLPIKSCLQICYLLAKALEYAHQQSVIHRDIKPENVLVRVKDDDISVWLSDFGISQLQMDGLTRTGSVFGTLAYASPEQKRSAADVTAKSDLYSVGVLLYELLTQRLPEGYFEPASTLIGSLPKGTDDLIRDCLAGRVENRISDAGLLAARLAALIKQIGAQPKALFRKAMVESISLGEIILDSFQPQKAPQVTIDGVPGLSEQILLLEGEVALLVETLKMIDAETHPKIVAHREQLDQLTDRVAGLREQAKDSRPAKLASHQYVELEKLVRNGDVVPSVLQRSFPGLPVEQLFSYVEQLSALVKAEDRLASERGKLESNIKHQKSELNGKLASKQNQLRKLRREDLEQLVRRFFKQHKQQNPKANAFPLAAWARFQSEVLSMRRYDFTDLEISEIAEHIWNPRTAPAPNADVPSSELNETSYNKGALWGTASILILCHGILFFSGPFVMSWVSPHGDDSSHTLTNSVAGTSNTFRLVAWLCQLACGGLFWVWYSDNRSAKRLVAVCISIIAISSFINEIVFPYLHAHEPLWSLIEWNFSKWQYLNQWKRAATYILFPVSIGLAIFRSHRAMVIVALACVILEPIILPLLIPIECPALIVRQQLFMSVLSIWVSTAVIAMKAYLAVVSTYILWLTCLSKYRPRKFPQYLATLTNEIHSRMPWRG